MKNITSLREGVLVNKTSLTAPLFIEVPEPSQKSWRSCICVLVKSFYLFLWLFFLILEIFGQCVCFVFLRYLDSVYVLFFWDIWTVCMFCFFEIFRQCVCFVFLRYLDSVYVLFFRDIWTVCMFCFSFHCVFLLPEENILVTVAVTTTCVAVFIIIVIIVLIHLKKQGKHEK